jgi:ribosomal-protein-serine acetyltransferase
MSEVLPTQRPHTELIIDDELSLREVALSDAANLFRITDENRDYLSQWLPWVKHVTAESDSADFVTKTHQERDAGTGYGFGLFVDGELAGHIGLMHTLSEDRDPEIGYWVDKKYSGRGLTTKAAAKLTNFGFGTLGLDKIIIRAEPANIASNKIAEKLGYSFEKQTTHETDKVLLNVWSKINPQ